MYINLPSYNAIHRLRVQLNDTAMDHWLRDDVFSLNWWILAASVILPLFCWWKLADKRRLEEILVYGLLCALCSTLLDTTGVNMVLWSYPDLLFPMLPILVPADLVVIPILGMLCYQYFISWKAYLIASAVLAGVFSFIFEPLFIQLGMFRIYHWKHIYAFLGFVLIFMINKLLTAFIFRIKET
ncbi:CBO0543 family protein [Peribacillus sp. SCS-37]|uniref:CBO0543 family protein n=1 Tax=Paraperibacillus esterisolvens TaxID=3115296 RepID=UPI00390680B6